MTFPYRLWWVVPVGALAALVVSELRHGQALEQRARDLRSVSPAGVAADASPQAARHPLASQGDSSVANSTSSPQASTLTSDLSPDTPVATATPLASKSPAAAGAVPDTAEQLARQYILIGTTTTPGASAAVFRKRDGNGSLKLGVGDQISGHTVVGVGQDRVTFSAENAPGQLVLRIPGEGAREDAGADPDTAPPPPPPRRIPAPPQAPHAAVEVAPLLSTTPAMRVLSGEAADADESADAP
jgi:hypothetical protein